MLARSSKHCHFRSRTCWKNGSFLVHSCAGAIDISKFEKKWECMWTFSRATADSLWDAGGTIALLHNLQA